MEILQSMNSATQVTVTVERNGQSSQINMQQRRGWQPNRPLPRLA